MSEFLGEQSPAKRYAIIDAVWDIMDDPEANSGPHVVGDQLVEVGDGIISFDPGTPEAEDMIKIGDCWYFEE